MKIPADAVIAATCLVHQVHQSDLLRRPLRRHPQLVKARCTAVAALRQVTILSYPEIAQALAMAGHSTAVEAAQRADAAMVARVVSLLRGGVA